MAERARGGDASRVTAPAAGPGTMPFLTLVVEHAAALA